MIQANQEYKRLPGRHTGLLSLIAPSPSSLWLGPDHLLCVSHPGYNEEYKRFQYVNIQGLVSIRTSRGSGGSALAALVAAMAGALEVDAWLLGWPVALTLVLATLAGLSLLVLLVNALRGPTCICRLHTQVQVCRLESLSRLRPALKALAAIRERVEQAQGRLPETEPAFEPRQTTLPTGPTAESAATLPPPPVVPSAPLRPARVGAHRILFWILLTDLCHSFLELAFHGNWLVSHVPLFTIVGLMAAAITAVILQFRTDLPLPLKVMPWTAIAYVMTANVAGLIHGLFLAIVHRNKDDPLAIIESLSPWRSPFSMGMLILSVFYSATAGITGLLLLRRFIRSRAAIPTPALPAEPPAPPPSEPPAVGG